MLRAFAALAPTAIFSLGCSLAFVLPAFAEEKPAAVADEEGFVSLFNGKDFSGWHKEGGEATYEIDGEDIVGKVGPGPNTFLCTDKLYGDFIFKCELKLDIPGNSGVQFRSQVNDKGRVFGYQMEIDPSDRRWAGGIYDEGRRGWLYPLEGMPEKQAAFKVDDWNEYVIECRGPHIRTYVNGVPCADLLDAMTLEGLIALQVHSGKEGQIRWRNVRVKDLGKTEWTSLFDGESLAGWNKIGGGDWKVEDGAIVGTATTETKEFGHLVADGEWSDFAVRVLYKADQGNSGLYFRVAEEGKLGVTGFQAEIDPDKDAGGLYESGGRAWVVQPKPEDVKKWYKPGEWNEMTVIALGDRVAVHVNGYKSAEIKNDPGRKSGKIALQVHADQDVKVSFKEVEIIDLSKQD